MNITLSKEDIKKIVAQHYNISEKTINIEENIDVNIDVLGDSLSVLIPKPSKTNEG